MEARELSREFLSDVLPDGYEAVLDREKLIRNQHMIDIENTSKKSYETGTWSKHKPLRALISIIMPQLIAKLEARLETEPLTARSMKPCLLRLKSENYKGYIYLSLMTLLDESTKNAAVGHAMAAIGSICHDEARFRFWHETAPKFYNFAVDLAYENTKDPNWIKSGLVKAFNGYVEGKYKDSDGVHREHKEAQWENWDKRYRSFIKKTMFELIYLNTGLFETEGGHYNSHANREELAYRLRPTRKLLEWVGNADAELGLHGGFYLPLPIPPRPWTSTMDGGFWTIYGDQLPLVKNRNEAYQEEILNLSDQFKTVFAAVNAAQNTAWHVNNRVFEVLKALVQEGKLTAGLPAADDLPLPCCPKCGQQIYEGVDHPCLKNKETLKTWKSLAKAIHKKNVKMRGQRLRLGIALETVELIRNDKAFYYVYQTDFRGRLYPLGGITPQGTDWEKGILEFAEGIPLGPHGAKWLAVHIANCWGNDKVSYAEREQWTKENAFWFIKCAREPLIYREWTEADSPFMFLAAAMEWEQYLREGDSFVSHIPVGLDGSCSGIQHYSALLRDEAGALATNVKTLPGQKKKSDIYGAVAEKAIEQFKIDAVSGDKEIDRFAMFSLAHNMMDRKVCKRAVMTLPYGSTYQACHKYTTEKLEEKPEINQLPEDQRKKYCRYVSGVVWQSIPKVVLGARQGMDFLKTLAHLVVKSACPITWVAPTGFVIHQSYYVPKVSLIWTELNGGTRVRITQVEDSKYIDKARQVSGIAPNFIHSLDASHLMFSVVKAHEQGITAFALVHDSLGTHAGKTQEFFEILRERFHYLYKNFTPLHTFVSHVKPLIPEDMQDKIPEIPMLNTLDIDCVLTSDYLFS